VPIFTIWSGEYILKEKPLPYKKEYKKDLRSDGEVRLKKWKQRIGYLGILADSRIEECKDGSFLVLAVPLISITKQEKRNSIFIQRTNFPNAIALPI